MGKQIAKLGIRPEDCGCYTDDSAFGVDFNWWSRDWD